MNKFHYQNTELTISVHIEICPVCIFYHSIYSVTGCLNVG